jgi:hypothetical protein
MQQNIPEVPPTPLFNYHFQKKSGYKVYTNGHYVHESDENYELDPTEKKNNC